MKWMDMHCDTVSELFRKRSEGTLWKNKLCVDIERLKKSDSVAQFFACYVNAAEYPGWEEAFDAAEKLIQSVHEEEAKEFCVAGSGAELEAAEQAKKYAGILTVEEGGVLNGKAERVEQLYEQGVRLLTLTWNYENCIGSPNSRDTEVMQRGLKPFGIEVVRRMNELGMLVDVSHLSDGGFWDCIRYSTDPIVASHSNCRELCRHPRNLTDEMLRAVGEKGSLCDSTGYMRGTDRWNDHLSGMLCLWSSAGQWSESDFYYTAEYFQFHEWWKNLGNLIFPVHAFCGSIYGHCSF